MLTKFSLFLFIFFLVYVIGIHSPMQAVQSSSKIKIVVFDFGGVIAKKDKEDLAKTIAQLLDISSTEALVALTKLKEYTNKGGEEEDFWPIYVQSLNKKLPDQWKEKLEQAKLKALKEIPGMITLVKNLKQLGIQTALLSNVRENQAHIKRQLGYYDLFQPVLLSYEIGFRKPDPKAYQILLDQLQVPSQSILFIDNKLSNIEAAKALKIDGIYFLNAEQLVQELQQRGIFVSESY